MNKPTPQENSATRNPALADATLLERIRALKSKTAAKQAAIDACEGHIWRADYVSQIVSCPSSGGSSVCVRCGERRGWRDLKDSEQREYQTP
jgi:hypothetical protein